MCRVNHKVQLSKFSDTIFSARIRKSGRICIQSKQAHLKQWRSNTSDLNDFSETLIKRDTFLTSGAPVLIIGSRSFALICIEYLLQFTSRNGAGSGFLRLNLETQFKLMETRFNLAFRFNSDVVNVVTVSDHLCFFAYFVDCNNLYKKIPLKFNLVTARCSRI